MHEIFQNIYFESLASDVNVTIFVDMSTTPSLSLPFSLCPCVSACVRVCLVGPLTAKLRRSAD